MGVGCRQALNRDDALSCHRTERGLAGPDRLALQVNRARATEAHTATVFRPGQHENIAQDPQEGHARVTGHRTLMAIQSNGKLRHRKLIVMLNAKPGNLYLADGWRA